MHLCCEWCGTRLETQLGMMGIAELLEAFVCAVWGQAERTDAPHPEDKDVDLGMAKPRNPLHLDSMEGRGNSASDERTT